MGRHPAGKEAMETRIVHGLPPVRLERNTHSPPIYMTSTFTFENADHGAGIFDGSASGYVYTRIGNPTVDLFEKKMASLEGGDAAVATGSGMAAIAGLAMSLCRPGDNFIACTTLYGGTFALFDRHLRAFGIEPKYIAPQTENMPQRILSIADGKTRFLYVETPANPTLDILSIKEWAEAAGKLEIPLAVDNTFATPYLQQPLSLGANAVIHSATKYVGGHADVIAGVVVGDKDLILKIREEYLHHFGPALSPMNAWLLLRGVRTLAVRMDRHCDNAEKVAAFLEGHSSVSAVYYPGLPAHPGHPIAAGQMKRYGGMLSFEVNGGVSAGKSVMDRCRLCTLAVSLGDCDTLIQHPASMTHSTYSQAQRKEAGITDGLIRLSVGIEHSDDIIADLDQALGH